MKRENAVKNSKSNSSIKKDHQVIQRLDESLPLDTEAWRTVEQSLMRLTEFAPRTVITDLVNAIACYADDQARSGYILGQEDLMAEMTEIIKRVA